MSVIRLARIVGTAGVMVTVPFVVVLAQTQSPPPSSASPPAATKPEFSAPSAAPQATPSTTPSEKKAAAPATADQLVGLTAKSSEGTNLGTVQAVIMEPNGKTDIGLKVGGFLGFGGHIVAIPDGKYNRLGDTIAINMTADEVNKLPRSKTQK